MRKYCFIFVIITFCFAFNLSCDKMDCNNGLDGQWQMYEWTSPSGEYLGGKDMKIYYSFQLQMMMFQKLSYSSGYLLSSFENKGTYIRVYDPIKYKGNGHDDILSMDTLAQYGVPFDGLMNIEQLTSDNLVLKSNNSGTLKFRKY